MFCERVDYCGIHKLMAAIEEISETDFIHMIDNLDCCPAI